ncbi:MAG: hypothetical protein GWP09_02835 [Nitrospiraceae bacterium]|nr:hypothetical protein [Nitrospiraceae bacterium]
MEKEESLILRRLLGRLYLVEENLRDDLNELYDIKLDLKDLSKDDEKDLNKYKEINVGDDTI